MFLPKIDLESGVEIPIHGSTHNEIQNTCTKRFSVDDGHDGLR